MHSLNKTVLLLFLVSTFLLSTPMAGRQTKFMNMLAEDVDAALEEGGEGEAIHERVLRANTKDYGRYDPSPALVKPPFKLIPN